MSLIIKLSVSVCLMILALACSACTASVSVYPIDHEEQSQGYTATGLKCLFNSASCNKGS
jgi:hypothetical protein